MDRFELVLGKVAENRSTFYENYDREIPINEKAWLCISLVQSFNNIPHMTEEDIQMVALELMHLKTSQLKTMYKRIHHREYEK
jgi:hypothetical protein